MEEIIVAHEQFKEPVSTFNAADSAELNQLQLALVGSGLAETMPF